MKPGYKQTEIGVIPEKWGVGLLREAFPRLDAGVSVNSDERVFSDYYVLKTSAIRNGVVNIRESKPVISSDYSRLKCPVKKGSIIISRMNTPAMVGECGFSAEDAPNTFLPDRLWQIEALSSDYDFKWMNYLLNTERYGAAIRSTATGTSNSMKNIAKDRLLEIAVPKPPHSEQEHIAEALSDMDELIASLEKLIAKKKVVKQGAMQELLTGKRRLPGCDGEWKTEDNCFLVEKGTQINGAFLQTNLPYPLYNGGVSSSGNTQKFNYENRVIISEGGNSCGFVNYIPKKFWAGGHCYVVVSSKIHMEYLYHLLKLKENEIMSMRVGSGLPNIQKESLLRLALSFPYDRAEQEAIAEAITEMSKEITNLVLKLVKARQIKQGMMQQLLTGMIRLI